MIKMSTSILRILIGLYLCLVVAGLVENKYSYADNYCLYQNGRKIPKDRIRIRQYIKKLQQKVKCKRCIKDELERIIFYRYLPPEAGLEDKYIETYYLHIQ